MSAVHAATLRTLMLLLCLVACLPQAQAETRAWLDRDRIALGETATLNIETDAAGAQAPDYAPLDRDFEAGNHTSRRQYELRNGQASTRTLFAVALQPRRAGVATVPALEVGGERTQPLSLTVTPAAPARAGGTVFIEAEADHDAPYVQQAVGYVVRLYYATQLVSGQLDQDAPDGASIQRVGNDVQYTRDIGGRRYTVVERRYLLLPERSGELVMPGARFQGRGLGGFLDDFFGDGQRNLSARGPARTLQVRPVPDAAPQPWLPLHGLEMRYQETPRRARAGAAATVVVEATADGATAAQMPELELDVGDGAQVFAEPVQVDESFEDGRPKLRLVRRFSVVPAQAGALHIRGPRLEWWDVGAERARVASLPELEIEATPGTVPTARADAATSADDGWVRVPGVQGEVGSWALATVGFALLWLLTLAWALQLRQRPPAGHPAAPEGGGPAAAPAARSSSAQRELRRALDTGELGEVEAALRALATPVAADLDTLQALLADPTQRDAVAALQRARWAGGDAAPARAAVRAAFAKGPRWVRPTQRAQDLLPPLYPRPD